MSDTSTDKKEPPKPELEWVFGNGGKVDLSTGWFWCNIWVMTFAAWSLAYIRFGMNPYVGRALIVEAWMLFIWACVWVRRLPIKRCDPECYQCRRQG